MSSEPVLVLQLQRLGDLILTFPLLIDLQKRFASHPIWVVAEPAFFQQLMPFAPNAVFFPPEHMPVLAKEKYKAIFNFSSRHEAAQLTEEAEAELKLGQRATSSGIKISGFWQLYRASLTLNNRHNAFHWADLNRLDCGLPLPPITIPLASPASSGRIGLFIGASEPAKRPEASFWIDLASRLAKEGCKPVLLGGPAEREAGEYIARQSNLQAANFCGKTNLMQLAGMIRSLDLFITPDTGPMHLANWLGTPLLNLSMGNVNAAETGPINPGQFILKAKMSCYGCWRCSRPKLYCKRAFIPRVIEPLAKAIINKENKENIIAHLPTNLELLTPIIETSAGLIQLANLSGNKPNLQDRLRNFWKSYFINIAADFPSDLESSAAKLAEDFPGIAKDIRNNLGKALASFSLAAKKGIALPDDFWRRQPWHSRIYAGYLQMTLQNNEFSRPAMLESLNNLAALEELFSRHI